MGARADVKASANGRCTDSFGGGVLAVGVHYCDCWILPWTCSFGGLMGARGIHHCGRASCR